VLAGRPVQQRFLDKRIAGLETQLLNAEADS
jgi:hypothetical protein